MGLGTLARMPPIAARRSLPLLALMLTVPAPSLGVFVGLIHPSTAGTPLGKAIFMAAKLWILIVPAVWLVLRRSRADGLAFSGRGIGVGIALGLAISIAIACGFFLLQNFIDFQQVREAAGRVGLNSIAIFFAFAVYTTFVNSLLEEYVWRWFVFRQCEQLMAGAIAVVASALMFTAHHTLALKVYCDWPITLLASGGVFVGGCAWSWCYLRFRSIWPGYVSHIIVDAAIFAVIWRILWWN